MILHRFHIARCATSGSARKQRSFWPRWPDSICIVTCAPLSCQVITLIEVVEHLDPPELNAVGPILLGRCSPQRMVVTTPNKEYNLNWIVPPAIDPSTGKRYTAPPLPPPTRSYPLRNRDHRFEWTRQEFMEWARELASSFGYTVEFRGIGGGPMDDCARPFPDPWPANPKAGDWYGPGPQTQAAIFERDPTIELSQEYASAHSEIIEPVLSLCC